MHVQLLPSQACNVQAQAPVRGKSSVRFMEKPQQANCFNQAIQIIVWLNIRLIIWLKKVSLRGNVTSGREVYENFISILQCTCKWCNAMHDFTSTHKSQGRKWGLQHIALSQCALLYQYLMHQSGYGFFICIFNMRVQKCDCNAWTSYTSKNLLLQEQCHKWINI